MGVVHEIAYEMGTMHIAGRCGQYVWKKWVWLVIAYGGLVPASAGRYDPCGSL